MLLIHALQRIQEKLLALPLVLHPPALSQIVCFVDARRFTFPARHHVRNPFVERLHAAEIQRIPPGNRHLLPGRASVPDNSTVPLEPVAHTVIPLRCTTSETPRRFASAPESCKIHQESPGIKNAVRKISQRIVGKSSRLDGAFGGDVGWLVQASKELLLLSVNRGGRRENGSRFRMLGRPIFRRKRYAPEARPRLGKLQSHFGFAAPHRAQERHMALLLFFRPVVLKLDLAPAGNSGLQQHQRSVCINRQRGCLFFKRQAFGVLTPQPHRHLHQNPLAPAPGAYTVWTVWRMTHKPSLSRLYRAESQSRSKSHPFVRKKGT